MGTFYFIYYITANHNKLFFSLLLLLSGGGSRLGFVYGGDFLNIDSYQLMISRIRLDWLFDGKSELVFYIAVTHSCQDSSGFSFDFASKKTF